MPVPLSAQTPSSYRDRTAELFSTAERLRKVQGVGTGPSTSGSSGYDGASNGMHRGGVRGANPPQTAAAGQSEFAKKASRIGLSIHQTSQKLAKLTKLAKRTSMFDDPAIEIQELTAVIKQDITALNTAIADLQQSSSFTTAPGSRNKHSNEHSATVVDNLKTRLMGTTKEFKDVLQMRTESLKTHQNRRQLFSAAPKDKDAGVTPFNRGGRGGSSSTSSSSALPWAANGAASASKQLFSSSRRRSSNESLLPTHMPSSSQSHMQQQQMVPVQDNYMASRAEALQNVESTIVELSTIFQQLATMVAQQGEMAIRIDENMDEAMVNVEGAQGALLKYLNRISSNRWLIMKIFFVLIIFLVIFVVFVA